MFFNLIQYKLKMHVIKKTPSDWFFLLQAIFFFAIARLILFFPFRYIAHYLGKANSETSYASPLQLDRLQHIKRAILRASRIVPWQNKCLVQALSGAMMLKRYRISCTLYLGINNKADRKLSAHAWLRSGNFYVTGEKNKDNYTIITSYAQEMA